MKYLLTLLFASTITLFHVKAQSPEPIETTIEEEPEEDVIIKLEGVDASSVLELKWRGGRNEKTRYEKYPKDKKLFQFKQNGKFGIADEEYNILIPAEYDRLMNLAAVKDGKYGAVGLNNEIIFPFEFDKISKFGEYGFAEAVKDGLFGVLYYTGEVRIPIEYADHEKLTQALYKVKTAGPDGKWGIHSVGGSKYFDTIYDEIRMEKGRFFVVKKNGLYGVKTALHNPVLPIEYEELHIIGNSFIIVVKNGKVGLFKEELKMVIAPEYEVIEIANFDDPFKGDIKFTKGEQSGKFIFDEASKTFVEE